VVSGYLLNYSCCADVVLEATATCASLRLCNKFLQVMFLLPVLLLPNFAPDAAVAPNNFGFGCISGCC
jgi:hypothetical protein